MIRAALVAAVLSVALIVVYLGQGGGDYSVAKAPTPCERRPVPSGAGDGLTNTIQRVAFTALDTAACDLEVTRERLLLALTGEAELPRGITEQERSEAFKKGLRAAIDREARAGRIPEAISGLLRNAIDFLPIDQLIQRFFESTGGGGGFP